MNKAKHCVGKFSSNDNNNHKKKKRVENNRDINPSDIRIRDKKRRERKKVLCEDESAYIIHTRHIFAVAYDVLEDLIFLGRLTFSENRCDGTCRKNKGRKGKKEKKKERKKMEMDGVIGHTCGNQK